jgi:hypothetical protein
MGCVVCEAPTPINFCERGKYTMSMLEKKAVTFRERFMPKVVSWFLGLFGYKMLLLGFVKLRAVKDSPGVLEMTEMRLIRAAGTQNFPSDPVTQLLFKSLMELQMNHLRELRAEATRKSTESQVPTVPAPDRHVN